MHHGAVACRVNVLDLRGTSTFEPSITLADDDTKPRPKGQGTMRASFNPLSYGDEYISKRPTLTATTKKIKRDV